MSVLDDFVSFTITKLAGPRGDIFDTRYPSSAKAGDPITGGVGVKNIGDTTGTLTIKVVDRDTDELLWSGSLTLAPAETGWVYPAFTMPARELRLRTECWYGTRLDDYALDTVKLATARGEITAVEYPPSALPGETVEIRGTAKNVGEDSGEFKFQLVDKDTGDLVDETVWFTLAIGEEAMKTLTGTMPERDWSLMLKLYRKVPVGAVLDAYRPLTLRLPKPLHVEAFMILAPIALGSAVIVTTHRW